jgi:hypothetical protein
MDPTEALFLNHLEWVEQQYCTACPWAAENRKLVRLWLAWGVGQGFLHTFSPGLILFYRPIQSANLDRYRFHYHETIFEFDRSGDTAIVDFCYAPGHVPFILGLLKRSGYPNVAWEHAKTGRIFFVPAKRLKVMGSQVGIHHDQVQAR